MNAIPEAVLSQHMAVLGKTGSGKTSTAKVAVERAVAGGARVCVLDPIKSDWWGLTSSADGAKPGLPFTILGGPKGHVPLHASTGKAIGELVAGGALPLSIIDMKGSKPGGHAEFFSAFAEMLMDRMTGVLHLVIEEAHVFAPKERSNIGAETMAIYWAKMLATAGRSIGVRLIVATQRTQSLHNALLGSCDTLIAHRLVAPADQEPVIKWLKANVADKAIREQVEGSLASLPTGQGWLCSGEAKIFELVTFPRIQTYDNTATPTGDAADRNVTTAKVDLDRLRAILGEAVSRAEAEDPKALKAEIARLRRAAAEGGRAPDGAALAEAREKGRVEGLEEGRSEAQAMTRAAVAGLLDRVRGVLDVDPTEVVPPAGAPPRANAGRSKPARQKAPAPPARQANRPKQEGVAAGGLGIPAQEFIEELRRRWPCKLTWTQAATLCGRKARGGSFNNARKELIDGGHVAEIDGKVIPAGVDRRPPLSHGELVAMWSSVLPGSARKLFVTLLAHHPCRFTWAQLATLSGMAARGGSFNNARRVLVDNQLAREENGLVHFVLEAPGAPRSREDLVAAWKAALPAPASQIFAAIASRKEPANAESIAAETGRQPRGGSWNSAMALLRANGLVREVEKGVFELGGLGQ